MYISLCRTVRFPLPCIYMYIFVVNVFPLPCGARDARASACGRSGVARHFMMFS